MYPICVIYLFIYLFYVTYFITLCSYHIGAIARPQAIHKISKNNEQIEGNFHCNSYIEIHVFGW